MIQKGEKKRTYAIYTGMFLIMCLASFLLFIVNGKSFVWGAGIEDGLSQHFSALGYYGEYLREAVGNFFSGHFKLPMWDMSLAYGGDILQMLNYYAIGDPLNFLYGFVPLKHTEIMYNFMILLRLYLAGIAFLLYTKKMNKQNFASIIGALVYVFCGFSFRLGIRHPFFINSMIYFPLLCLGIEKIYKKEKPYLFIVTVCIAATSNYYFLYMLTIFAVIYAWIRFYDYYKKNRVKNFFMVIGKFALRYALGIAMAAIILIPAVIGFLHNGRGGQSVDIRTLIAYPLRHYIMFFENIIGYGNTGFNTNAGYLPIAGIAVLFLIFSRRMHHKKYKIAFLSCVVALIFPIFGFAFNGFSYSNNRWGFVFGFIVALLTTEMYPRFFIMTRRQKKGIGLCVIGYNIFAWIILALNLPELKNPGIWAAGILLAIFYLMTMWFQKKGWDNRSRAPQVIIMTLLIVAVSIHGFFRFGDDGEAYTNEFIDCGKSLERLQSPEAKLLKSVNDDDFYRVHMEGYRYKNYGLLNNLNTISGYYSIVDANVADTVRSYETLGMEYLDKFQGLDQRTGLLSLSGVKYMTTSDKNGKQDVPEGFNKLKEKGGISLYENEHWLPMAYSYTNFISENQYEALNGVGREQAMLSNVVLEENFGDDNITRQPVFDNVSATTIPLSSKRISSPEGEQYMDISVPVNKEKETYIYIKGLQYDSVEKEAGDFILSGGKKTKGIVVEQNEILKDLYIQSPFEAYYFGREDYMIKLNHQESRKKAKVRLRFLSPGTYSFDNAYMVVVDKKDTEKKIKALQKNALKDIQYEGNHFSGTYEGNKDAMACINIPYSKGWKATVDGKEVKINKANGMYMGISLNKGTHKIKLTYCTPGIFYGFLISAGAWIILVFGIIYDKVKKK